MISNDEEVRLLYLLSGSFDVLPFSYHKLRSHLNTHISNIAAEHNLNIKNFKSRDKICCYCYTPWNGETTFFKLLPSKKCRFQTQSKSLEEGTNTSKSDELKNTLVLKCKMCGKKSLFSLAKKKSVEERKPELLRSGKKKKKKKKDKTCGLIVNLKQHDISSEKIILKKKKRIKNTAETRPANLASLSSSESKLQKHIPVSKSQLNIVNNSCKKLVPSPLAVQPCNKFNTKRDKKLQRLKEAIKKNKSVVRTSLRDFLTLV